MCKYIKCGQSGIYFLLYRNKVVYIGKTKSFPQRPFSHYDKKFTKIRFIQCRKSHLTGYEQRWIRRFTPKYNKQSNPKVKSLAGFNNPLRIQNTEQPVIENLVIS